ncbi:vacuolar import and degradation protein 27 [Terfezia boudieri ATCC MYA-4762]|uniref:Vacuolar import and degradation protein 27 n=1 Tax=Terfezia boudieri ATCC MYA-4762 TaxID=1051890 RepID=A0A3N4LLB3_9PEZI|nr:vacuolar import and degradation protein 27 [Terfezia boudieri ATCC MYA-4762]
MFMLRNVGKYIFGDSSKPEIIHLDQGQLYIVRPNSPKGYSECIFKDAAACIRRTSTTYQYQLVIQRAYEEGEEQLLDDAEDAEDAKDEKIFLLDETLHLRSTIRDGCAVFAWRDLSGDPGDLYEFICESSVQPSAASMFELVAIQCQFERKYRRSHDTASEKELHEFSFSEPIPAASAPETPVASPLKTRSKSRKEKAVKAVLPVPEPTVAPAAAEAPATGDELAKEKAELHLFDIASGTFVMQDSEVTASVLEVGNWEYWLQVDSKDKPWLGLPVAADLNPVFNFEFLSFIFNHYTEDGGAYSWLLRFRDMETEERFQEGIMRALWEQLNQQKWLKTKTDERDYILEAFNDITMEDLGKVEEEEEEDVEDGEESGDEARSEHYDTDEEEEDVSTGPKDGSQNSQLAVGYKHDRSFVVRGSKIGVFRHTPQNGLEFTTSINKVATPKGKLFEPRKVMLHGEDQSMILQNGNDPNTLYRMDLEYGKVVDEWKVHDDIPVTTIAPENKFAQMTGEQTFLGLSNNALFRIDPRLSGNKLVESQLKQYVSKNSFSAAATTEKGYIAVASNKGDIRLFDRLGINAKTHIPALGEAIIGLDVSADGKWILGTCKTYLLLIDAEQKEGKNVGKLGFEKSFGKDSKPRPRRLGLNPSHVAQMQAEAKAPLSFTPAKFNTGLDAQETSIITSTGPFMITWNLKKILRGSQNPYTIKRYNEEVKADNFRFGSDKSVIVALPNEVNMVAKQTFKKPTRESISTPMRKSRSSIVDSRY